MDHDHGETEPESATPPPAPVTPAGSWEPETRVTSWPPLSETPPDPTPTVPEPDLETVPPAPSWAWQQGAAPTFVPPPAAGSPASAAPPLAVPRERRGARSALVGGMVGALVGALVAGGLVVAFDDDPTPQPVRTGTESAVNDTATRPATVIVEPGDISSILDAARPAVVRIDVTGDDGISGGTGTGFIIESDGIIVTNAHVVGNSDEVTVHLADGDVLDGEVLGADTRLDLAVVDVEGTDFPTLELGDSDALQVGDGVVAIGNALGISEGSGATVTTGIVSGLGRIVEVGEEVLFNAIQTDAAINPGNSGGPLVDANGRVIGINSAIAAPETANNIGFAIAITPAKQIIDDLRAGREPQIAFLGVRSEPLSPDDAADLGVDEGAIVVDVTPGSGAAGAGLQEGDVIVEVDGTRVSGPETVASEVRGHGVGDVIDVVIVRDGVRQTVSATLGDAPEDI